MLQPQLVTSDEMYKAMVDAGVLPSGEQVRRVVIDLREGALPVIHVERYGDVRLLKVLTTLDGVDIREVGRGEAGR